MNDIELNLILYYADFLSIRERSIPVTDTCKYFFIHKTPINSAYIVNKSILYDENNPYVLQAKKEYEILKDRFDEEAADSFIEDICNLSASGMVDGHRMLQCIHQYSDKRSRKLAFKTFDTYMNGLRYSHIKIDEDKAVRVPVKKELAHYELTLDNNTVEYDVSLGYKNDEQQD